VEGAGEEELWVEEWITYPKSLPDVLLSLRTDFFTIILSSSSRQLDLACCRFLRTSASQRTLKRVPIGSILGMNLRPSWRLRQP